jgi:predicted dinucleotide-binding enzyme
MNNEQKNMNIGIIGSGNIGVAAARLFITAGHSVAMSNSRGPETLQGLVAELGATAHAATVEEAVKFRELVLLAIPFGRYETLPADAFSGKIVMDADNYYPKRDGQFPELDADRTTSSELLAVHLPKARVIKAFNTIRSQDLATEANTSLPIDEQRAIFVAGDDAEAKRIVMNLIEQIGFGAVDTGTLAVGGRQQQPGTEIYGRDLTMFMERMKKAAKGNELDITSDEDLAIGIMNLISIEEHLFLTANKTGKDHYYDLLLEVREMRKELLKKIVLSFEGEVWCISKHLLASSMRLMEVGTKELKINGVVKAKPYFEKSYRLFRMFWETVLKQPGRKDGEQPTATPQKTDVVLYYEPTCPDCKLLDSFLASNGLNEVFNITKKDVTSDPANRAEMESVQKQCMNGVDKRVVPFVAQDGKCAMGEKDSIQFFKNLMWDKVKTSRTTMESLLVKDGVPTHVKTHVENHNKMVDAALNCCKE